MRRERGWGGNGTLENIKFKDTGGRNTVEKTKGGRELQGGNGNLLK